MIRVNCRKPIFVNGVIAPCGKCFSCRSKYRNQWRLRLQHELLTYDSNALFLTLTYNDKNLPENYSLVKKDLQLFFKRLRKFYKDVKIRYFAVGEYGDKKKRPHYHAIIYGLSAPEQKKDSSLNKKYSIFLSDKIWQKGFCYVGYCNSKTITYVSKYVMKNFVKNISNNDFKKGGMIPPFSLKSTGLGLQWLMDNLQKVKDDLINNRVVSLYKSKTSYPRYYRKKLIEFGEFDENFFRDRYYEEMDKVQDSIIQELKSAHVSLDPVRNYFNIPLSQLCRLPDTVIYYEKVPVKINLPRRYVANYTVNKIVIHPDVDKINDIYENHWFFVYCRYHTACTDAQLDTYILKNKDKVDYYE